MVIDGSGNLSYMCDPGNTDAQLLLLGMNLL